MPIQPTSPNPTNKQGHFETNKVSGEGQSATSSAPATSGGGGGSETAGDRDNDSVHVQGGEALTGSDAGSDVRAGSMQGGSAAGSETADDHAEHAQALSDAAGTPAAQAPMGEQRSFDGGDAASESGASVNNTGDPLLGARGDPVEGKRDEGDDVDAATG